MWLKIEVLQATNTRNTDSHVTENDGDHKKRRPSRCPQRIAANRSGCEQKAEINFKTDD